jgi:hypothetical protein
MQLLTWKSESFETPSATHPSMTNTILVQTHPHHLHPIQLNPHPRPLHLLPSPKFHKIQLPRLLRTLYHQRHHRNPQLRHLRRRLADRDLRQRPLRHDFASVPDARRSPKYRSHRGGKRNLLRRPASLDAHEG